MCRNGFPHCQASQCSLHNAPVLRLFLTVAAHGTHQCESMIYCGAFSPNLCGRGFGLQENGSGMSSTLAGQVAHSQLATQGLKPSTPGEDSLTTGGSNVILALGPKAFRRRPFGLYVCLYHGSSAPDARRTQCQWSRGRTQRCHRCDPGSIPGCGTFLHVYSFSNSACLTEANIMPQDD